MKRIINTLLISLASVFLFSCSVKEAYDVPMNETIVIDLSSGVTKAVVDKDDTQAESYVNHIDVLVFQDNAGSPSDLMHYGRYVVNDARQLTVNAQRSMFAANMPYHVYLVANSNLPESDFLAADFSYSDFVSKKQTDELLHLSGLTVEGAPKYFLMDAKATDGQSSLNTLVVLNNGNPADNTILFARLRRAAAKVVIKMTAGPNVQFATFGQSSDGMIQSDGGLYYIQNLPYQAFLLAEARADDTIDADVVAVRNTARGYDGHFVWNPEKDNKTASLVTYVYPNSWSSDIINRETCAVVNLPLIYTPSGGTPVEHHNSWYKIHMTGEKVFRRNNYYEVSVTINRPGATSETTPVNVDNVYYAVEEWSTQDIYVGGDDKPKYLSVNKTSLEMHNIAKDASTLEFASSSPVTITVKDAYYLDKFGIETAVPPSILSTINGVTDGGIAGNITVSSEVPKNNAIRYFTLVITNQDGLTREVKVTQYPLEYITGVVGSYSYRDDFFYADGHSNDEDNTSAPTTWNSQGDRITTASWNNGGWTYRKGQTGGAFTSKVAYQMYSSGLADIDYYYYEYSYFLGNVVKQRSHALSPGNPRMYHVQIKATSSTYTLGIPILDSDGYTDSGADNAKLVSPSFMLASQLGAVSSGDFDNYEMVASHCREYVEVYEDPETGQEVHLRDWRLPTRAEVEIIYKFQNNSEVMDEVLAGARYWCADKETVANPQYTLSGTFLRCIRDVY